MKIIQFNNQFFYSLFKKTNGPQHLLSFSRSDLKFCKCKMEIKTFLSDFVENARGNGAI